MGDTHTHTHSERERERRVQCVLACTSNSASAQIERVALSCRLHKHKSRDQDAQCPGTHTQAHTRHTHTLAHMAVHSKRNHLLLFLCALSLFGTEKVATFQLPSLPTLLPLLTLTLAQKDVAVVLRTLLCQRSAAQLEQKPRGLGAAAMG